MVNDARRAKSMRNMKTAFEKKDLHTVTKYTMQLLSKMPTNRRRSKVALNGADNAGAMMSATDSHVKVKPKKKNARCDRHNSGSERHTTDVGVKSSSTGVIVKRRLKKNDDGRGPPRGRPPKGKMWDRVEQEWIPMNADFFDDAISDLEIEDFLDLDLESLLSENKA